MFLSEAQGWRRFTLEDLRRELGLSDLGIGFTLSSRATASLKSYGIGGTITERFFAMRERNTRSILHRAPRVFQRLTQLRVR